MSELMTLASEVLAKHGRELWRHPVRFEAYLRDHAGQGSCMHDAENAVMLAVLRGGYLAALAGSAHQASPERQRQVEVAFVQKQGIPPAHVRAAFAKWAKLIDLDLQGELSDNAAPKVLGRSHLIVLKSQRPRPRSAMQVPLPLRAAENNVTKQDEMSCDQYVHLSRDLSPRNLMLAIIEINIYVGLIFIGILVPLGLLTSTMTQGNWSGKWTFIAYLPAVCGASWASFHLGKRICEKVITNRLRNQPDL